MDNTIGKKLQKYRKLAKLQQTNVAQKSNIPVNRISLCENGHANFTIQELIGLCDLYGVTPNDVLGYELDPNIAKIVERLNSLSPEELTFIANIIDSYESLRTDEREMEM